MRHEGLILHPPEPDHWQLGSGLASARFGAEDINPSGDWRKWLPTPEDQSRFGFESMNCTNYATIHAWITLAKFFGFTEPTNGAFMHDASERYTGVHTETTPSGNEPHHVAEVIRETCGLIPQASMPWSDDINTWDEYYDKRAAAYNLPLGKKLLDRFELGHEWVWAFGSSLTPKEKTAKLAEALKRGPVCVSVSGHYRTRGGAYYKDKDDQDTHWILLSNLERGNARIVLDQYTPFVKRFESDYDHAAAKVYFLKRKEENVRNFWSSILDGFAELWNRVNK